MKLLSASDVKSKKKSFEEVEMYEAYKAKKRLVEETNKLKQFKDGVAPEKKKVINEYFEFVQNMEKKKATILHEIESLETIKKHLLEPVDQMRMEVMEREERISLAEKEFYKKQHEFNEKAVAFNAKLGIIEEKEQKIAKMDAMTTANYKKSEEKLKTIIREEEIHAEVRTKLAQDEERLQLWATELSDREKATQAKLKAIIEKENEAKKTLKIIQSKQAALQAAFKEFNQK